MNRGIEITPEVADGPQSCVLEQVTNGIAVRMALLFLLISGHEDDEHRWRRQSGQESALHRSKDPSHAVVKNAASRPSVQDRRGMDVLLDSETIREVAPAGKIRLLKMWNFDAAG